MPFLENVVDYHKRGSCLPKNQNVRIEVRLSDFDIDNGETV